MWKAGLLDGIVLEAANAVFTVSALFTGLVAKVIMMLKMCRRSSTTPNPSS